jgi:hypothetical protein
VLLPHRRAAIANLREPSPSDPWRVLVSGCRLWPRHVATALLIDAGIPVVSHHEHPWTLEHLPGAHPRATIKP